MQYKYQLDPSPKKFVCPACNKKRFVRYINIHSRNYCKEIYGRCDREVKCGYHQIPEVGVMTCENVPKPQKPPFFISRVTFLQTLSNYEKNNLFVFISLLFGEQKARYLFSIYQIGTSKHWSGATILWQINFNKQIGQGKIMLFDKEIGKRIKIPFPHITSVHALLNKQDQKPDYCFWGEHMVLQFPDKPIAIVESEKTALVMAGIMADYLWIASGGLSQITNRRLNSFKNRKMVFYPDLGGYEKWNKKAEELIGLGFNISVSDLLEIKATEKDKLEGFDIADYFIKNKMNFNQVSDDLKLMVKRNPILKELIDRFQLIQIN